MDSTLEQQRRYHEERERIVDAMVKESLVKSSTNREVINSDHRLRYLRDRYMTATERVKELYEDKDSRDEEKATMSGSNALTEFYNRLRVIRDFHRKHPNEISVPMSVEFEDIAKQRESNEDSGVLVDFTDEEGYGKYLDLHESYNKFINLKGVSRVDYITYLATFDHLYEIPKERKTGQYKEYLTSLIDYLWGYVERLKPLLDLDAEMNVATTKFEEQWEAGKFPGWSRETGGALTSLGAHLDLSAFSSSEELMSLGLDRLKSALMALNLKCGGTLEERARRLFSTKGKSLNSVEPSLFARNRGSGGPIGPPTAANEKMRETATLEMQVYRLSEILTDQRMATRENVQRRQARREGEQDDSDEDAVLSDSDSDIDVDEEAPYNPKNLPLGWDGKPIPYWLYKLHGLNISYKCEICGNFVYKGPKAFQRHFAEWRHAHGMRCLGVPNTAHFANVTRIDEALELWQKLKAQKANERFVAEADEEFEDSLGNVVNRKTFDDLKRQGLL